MDTPTIHELHRGRYAKIPKGTRSATEFMHDGDAFSYDVTTHQWARGNSATYTVGVTITDDEGDTIEWRKIYRGHDTARGIVKHLKREILGLPPAARPFLEILAGIPANAD